MDDIIAYEGESTTVDFKAVPYRSSQHESFIKDILAMANAETTVPRYIIIGVKHAARGDRDVIGLGPDEHVDPSVFDQLIRENVEPDLAVEYFVHVHGTVRVGIFRLRSTPDAPYLMRKDYGNLRRGDGFIRKGTHQARLDRRDLERIYDRRAKIAITQPPVSVLLESTGTTSARLAACPIAQLPSVRVAARIRALLAERRRGVPPTPDPLAQIYAVLGGGGRPYESMDAKELEGRLRAVDTTYREHDAYSRFESGAAHIQINIENRGDSYVDDASLTVSVRAANGLVVADRVYADPSHEDRAPFGLGLFETHRGYPTVQLNGDMWHIYTKLGALQHKIVTRAFDEPLRIKAGPELIGEELVLECTLRGRQLKSPVRESLTLLVVEEEPRPQE